MILEMKSALVVLAAVASAGLANGHEDYHALLTKSGKYTPKNDVVKRLLAQHAAVALRTPPDPAPAPAPLERFLPILAVVLGLLVHGTAAGLIQYAGAHGGRSAVAQQLPMELAGQSYGFWEKGISEWRPVKMESSDGILAAPTFFKFEVDIVEPTDTWVDVRGWGKRIVLVNGFNLGRYLHHGPIDTLYWPASLQRKGRNEILVFELFRMPTDNILRFSSEPILE